MEINDDYILNKYWKTKQQTFSRLLKSNKCLKEEIDYVKTRYNDSLSIEETLYRMKHHIEEHPKCKICGKFLKWHYEYKTYCSKHCMMLDPALKEKRINGSIKKFGSKSSFSSKEVIAKRNLTWEKKYGGNPLKNDAIRHKIKHTCLEKYGVEYASQSNNSKFRYKQTCLEKYGVDNYAKTNECKDKVRKTCLKKYGDYFCNSQEANEKSHTKEANEKRYASMIKNNSWSVSIPEEKFYNRLCTYFNNSDIIRQYKDKRYPFHCDFYIKSLDLFIECNFHWTHGKHLYNSNSQEDIDIVNKWKSKNTKYYNKAIETWTIRDIKKDKYVKENNLHYVSLYNEDDVSNFYIDLEDKILNRNE